ncbi:MAG: UxaA family hydrolase [Peptococcaceae bacterium]|nr:UxaA family hydrolase [Peptococcaceae bacterium]
MHKIAYVVDQELDNVATIVENDICKGMKIPVEFDGVEQEILLTDDDENGRYTLGQKFAIRKIAKGETVTKYGLSIGRAMRDIEVGEWVHVHNIEPMRGRGDLHKDEANGGIM